MHAEAVNIALPRAKFRPVSLAGIAATVSFTVYARPGPFGVIVAAAKDGGGGFDNASSAARSVRSFTFTSDSVRIFWRKPPKLAPPFQFRVRGNHEKYSIRNFGVQP